MLMRLAGCMLLAAESRDGPFRIFHAMGEGSPMSRSDRLLLLLQRLTTRRRPVSAAKLAEELNALLDDRQREFAGNVSSQAT